MWLGPSEKLTYESCARVNSDRPHGDRNPSRTNGIFALTTDDTNIEPSKRAFRVHGMVSDDLDIVCCCRALRPSAGATCLPRGLQFRDVSRVAFVSSIAYVDYRVPAVAQTLYELLSPKTRDDVTHARRNTSNIEKTTSLAVSFACTRGCGGSVATPNAMVLSKTRLFFLTLCFLLKRFSGPARTGRFPAIRSCSLHPR